MSNEHNKRQKIDIVTYATYQRPIVRLPIRCKNSVRSHINSIYVGTIIRIYDSRYGDAGHLATAHWVTEEGIFATLHDESTSDFVQLKYNTWVVDQRHVRPGAFILFTRFGTDDIADDTLEKNINEIKQLNSRVLTNDTLMDYPTKRDRETYSCSLFRLTCNCGLSKRVKLFTCSETNLRNRGKRYYACIHRYSKENESCNFFVWADELEHDSYTKCDCGNLCKKVNVSSDGTLPVHKFVCVNRGNKSYVGCKTYLDA